MAELVDEREVFYVTCEEPGKQARRAARKRRKRLLRMLRHIHGDDAEVVLPEVLIVPYGFRPGLVPCSSRPSGAAAWN